MGIVRAAPSASTSIWTASYHVCADEKTVAGQNMVNPDSKARPRGAAERPVGHHVAHGREALLTRVDSRKAKRPWSVTLRDRRRSGIQRRPSDDFSKILRLPLESAVVRSSKFVPLRYVESPRSRPHAGSMGRARRPKWRRPLPRRRLLRHQKSRSASMASEVSPVRRSAPPAPPGSPALRRHPDVPTRRRGPDVDTRFEPPSAMPGSKPCRRLCTHIAIKPSGAMVERQVGRS